ncbi:hypothetical protein ACX93W_26815 [Paenibacillus sp. CAU 1782]
MKGTQLMQEVKEALSKATPGPWIVFPDAVGVDNSGNWICQMYEGDPVRTEVLEFENAQENARLIAAAPELLQRMVDSLEEANRTIADKERENAVMKKLLMDVSEHLSWRNVDGSGPAKALGMIYAWAALSHEEDKTDDQVD